VVECVWPTGIVTGTSTSSSSTTSNTSPPNAAIIGDSVAFVAGGLNSYITTADNSNKSNNGASNTVQNSGQQQQQQQQQLHTVEDMRLLHHYTADTYSTLDTAVAQRPLWQKTVVELGFRHPFLLHGILAIAALHLAVTTIDPGVGRQHLVRSSSAHINVALGQFRKLLDDTYENNVNRDNCTALFVFSCIVVVYNFAVAQTEEQPTPDDDPDPLAALLNCIRLVRGVNSVLQPHWLTLMTSEVAPLLLNGCRRGVSGKEPEIMRLRDLIITSVTSTSRGDDTADDDGSQACCLEAVEQLNSVFLETKDCPSGTGAESRSKLALLFTWPVTLSERFVELVSERHPVTLVILAHFAVLLRHVGDCWWLAGWCERIIDAVEAAVGWEYQEWLLWPKQHGRGHGMDTDAHENGN